MEVHFSACSQRHIHTLILCSERTEGHTGGEWRVCVCECGLCQSIQTSNWPPELWFIAACHCPNVCKSMRLIIDRVCACVCIYIFRSPQMSLPLSLTASPPKCPASALILHAGSKTGRPTWSDPRPGWHGHCRVPGSAVYYCSISEPGAGVGWRGCARAGWLMRRVLATARPQDGPQHNPELRVINLTVAHTELTISRTARLMVPLCPHRDQECMSVRKGETECMKMTGTV